MKKRIWLAAAAPTMMKLSLELGGTASCLVFDDVDVNRVRAARRSGNDYCGPTMHGRVHVHASRYDAMKAHCVTRYRRWWSRLEPRPVHTWDP